MQSNWHSAFDSASDNHPFLSFFNQTFSMSLLLIFTSLLGQATLMPPDSSTITAPVHGSGLLIGVHTAVVEYAPFRVAPGPVAGYYWFHDLNDRVTLRMEFVGKAVGGYREQAVFSDAVITPEGVGRSLAIFNLRSLLFLEMPVLFQFRRDRTARHGFFAGLRPSANFVTGDNSGYLEFSTVGNVSPTDFRSLTLRRGVHEFDLSVVAGWNYALTRRLNLDVRYSQGLFDLTADNFFKNKSNTLNAGLQVSLRADF